MNSFVSKRYLWIINPIHPIMDISRRGNVLLTILLLNILIVGYFWIVLGINYTPVNDGWVSVSYFDSAASQGGVAKWWSDARSVRSIPFYLASQFDRNGFITLNLFLAVINIFTGLGIFLILDRFYPAKALFSAVTSLLIMYFPYDGTMFWLGAFGVNFGYLLCIYALYFFIRSVETPSKIIFMISILLLLASGKTYPGYLPVQVLILSLYLWLNKASWKVWWPRASIFIVIWMIGLVKFADNAASGAGREGNVAHFDMSEVLKGFGYAFRHLYVGVYEQLWEFNPDKLDIMAVVIVLMVAIGLNKIWRSSVDENDMVAASKEYKKIVLHFVVIAPLILMAGYVLYAVSDIRYGTDRQLLFARSGVVLFYIAILFWLIHSFFNQKRIACALIVLSSSLIIGLSLQAKTKIANEYAIASQVERIFLGDVAELMPEIIGNPYIIIYFEDNNIIVNKHALMLLNRPQYLMGYLYRRYDLDVIGANKVWLHKYNAKIRGGVLQLKGQDLSVERLLVLGYSLKRGIRVLDHLRVPIGKKGEEVFQIAKREIETNRSLTARQRWFVGERDRLVKMMGLR